MAQGAQPKFDLLRRYGGSVERLRAAVEADSALRTEAALELAAIAPIEKSGRCVVTRDYGQALRRALSLE